MVNKEKRDWKKIVSESDGAVQFVPEKFHERVKEWQKMRAEFNKELERVAKNEIVLGNFFNAIMLDLRQHFSDAGMEIWQKDVNFIADALKDGDFIVQISSQK